jgi:hypothetical protein
MDSTTKERILCDIIILLSEYIHCVSISKISPLGWSIVTNIYQYTLQLTQNHVLAREKAMFGIYGYVEYIQLTDNLVDAAVFVYDKTIHPFAKNDVEEDPISLIPLLQFIDQAIWADESTIETKLEKMNSPEFQRILLSIITMT